MLGWSQASKAHKPAVTVQPKQPPALPVTLSLDDCHNLSDEELLKIYQHKVRDIPLDKPQLEVRTALDTAPPSSNWTSYVLYSMLVTVSCGLGLEGR